MSSIVTLAGVVAVLAALGLLSLGWLRLREARALAHSGRLLASDAPRHGSAKLTSPRYRLVGRPDEIRELPDGSLVPVEIKSRTAPRSGPPRSHRIQVEAYALLLQESTGRAPPYGLLRYGDGTEYRVPWDHAAARELLHVREEIARPYDGRATPSVARCARCTWRAGCDVRVA